MRVYIWTFRLDSECSDPVLLINVQGYFGVSDRATYLHIHFLTSRPTISSDPYRQPFLLFPPITPVPTRYLRTLSTCRTTVTPVGHSRTYVSIHHEE